MKNITVSVDDEVYHRARIRAAEEKTSVSAMVRGLLREISEEKTEFDRLKDLENETVRTISINAFSASDRLDREQLHDDQLLSEDLSDGQNYDGIQVINPFRIGSK